MYRDFIEELLEKQKEEIIEIIKDGYELSYGSIEYLVYWYNSEDDKEYMIVLPKLRFVKKENHIN